METITRRAIPWPELEKLQAELIDRVTHDPRQSFLLVSEPTPTFTYGISAQPDELLWKQPDERGVSVHKAGRGGRWTYHGPGQVVIYPIAFLPTLGYRKRAVKKFLADLSSSVQRFLSDLGLPNETRDKPFGVFLSQGKVASFGVAIQNGISSHGVAVYLRPQKAFFEGIVPCGVCETSVSSLEEAGASLSWETAANNLTDYIKRGFQASKN